MINFNIPFYKPSVDQKEIENITDLILNNNTNNVEEFENDIKKYIGTRHAISAINSTAAITLALATIELKRGDKVLMSVNSSPNAPECVRHFDSEPIFIDICDDSYSIDLDKFENYLKNNNSKKLRAAIINFISQGSMDLDRLYLLCDKYNIILIEDASGALGATYKEDLIGTLGSSMTIFSMNNSSLGNTSVSNCSVIVTNNEDIANRARLIRAHGITKSHDENGDLDYLYDVVDIGYKYEISELEAAFNIAQLKKTNKFISRRLEIANMYCSKLSNLRHIKVPKFCEDQIYSNFIIEIDKNRDTFARELKNHGIATNLTYIPLHLLSYYKNKYNLKIMAYPNALNIYSRILSIPIYDCLSNEEVEYICSKIIDIEKEWI